MGLVFLGLTFGNLLLRSGRVKSHRTPESQDLAEEVRELLLLHRGRWKAIAPATDVSYSWLSKFSRGLIENPGYATLKRVKTLLVRDGPPTTATTKASDTSATRPRRAKRLIAQEA